MNRGITIGEFQHRLSQIEEKHGRIAKSQFVIANWIIKAKWFELAAIRHDNERMFNTIYRRKQDALEQLFESNMCNIKKHGDALVLELELEGMQLNLVADGLQPFLMEDPEETDINQDQILLDGIEYKDKRKFKLDFILDNIEKSRLKLIDKMKEI